MHTTSWEKIHMAMSEEECKMSYLPVMTTLRGPALQCSSRTLFAPSIVPIITPPSQLYQISASVWLSPPKYRGRHIINWNPASALYETKRNEEYKGNAVDCTRVYDWPDNWNPTASTTPLLIIVITYLPTWVATWEEKEISHYRSSMFQKRSTMFDLFQKKR